MSVNIKADSFFKAKELLKDRIEIACTDTFAEPKIKQRGISKALHARYYE